MRQLPGTLPDIRKPEEQLKASYQAAQGRPIVERGIATERAIGHRLTRDYSLEAAVSGQRSVYVDTVKGDNTMDLTFRPYRKTTKSRARPLTEEDYRQRGGLIQTIEGPARFAIGDYLGKDDKGEFPIRRVKVERDYRQITPPDAEGWADYMPFDVREAAQVSEPFELNGQHGKTGDYIVRGSDSRWIVDRELFEASYRPV